MRTQFAATAPAALGGVTSGSSSGGGATDPRFSYCYEANDNGYGPYRRGVDPEYAWYDDADNDGVVCE
ncbi:excalibur calcium-binding domain-containing protein [Nocardioides iriomotensis]|uniref:Excalibur calcium-binding domain-containing protein n=2 Tax=Nocardioides iriomotensis TaxID=715784 RepID=A0A4Q5IV29_9ACTN|nr:excalibur calcium-binding domain-containing protein [Nocardioides iriomotensis]